VPDADLGFYRVASRIVLPITMSASALTLAWLPVRRTSLFAAAREESGAEAGVRLITYFSFCCFWMLLAISVGANGLVRIAGPSYESAAQLIPVLGFSVALFGFSRIVYRGVSIRNKQRKYIALN